MITVVTLPCPPLVNFDPIRSLRYNLHIVSDLQKKNLFM